MTPLPTAFLTLLLATPVAADADLDAALLRAVRKGDTPAAKALLLRGADAGARDKDGTPALMWAGVYGDAELLDALLEKGADVSAKNKAGATALMWAAGSAAKVKRLLDRGADPNARTDSGFSPLLIAAGNEDSAGVVRLLLDRGAAAGAASNSGFTALMAAAATGDGEAVRLLLRKGADPKAKNKVGYTALHAAATAGNADAARALLDGGADVNAADKLQGKTPLSWAAAAGAADVVKLLLEKGADPNVQGTFAGDTALMWAAIRGDAIAVRELLARGADPGARDKRGRTPLDWALRQGDDRLAAALRPAGRGAEAAEAPRTAALKLVGEANTVAAALARSLPLLERTVPAFTASSEERCATCHHQSLPAMALGLARDRGLRVDAKLLRDQAAESLALLAPQRDRYLQGTGVVDRLDPGYWLAGLSAAGVPADETTDALVHYLTLKQSADGRWRATLYRPPMVGSEFTTTALSLRALQRFAPPARAAEAARRVGRARDWLRSATPKTTEDRVFQLLSLAWSGADAEAVRKSATALLALRRADGGWAQLPTLASDAYATGQALYALREAGGLAVADPVYRGGVSFLLRNQCEDGSWFVQTRALPVQPYFESGFPHGRSQFVSCAATCWATMALVPAAGR